MELGARLSVFGTPFFYVMEPDGSPVARLPGYQDAEEFLLFDSYVNGGHYQQQTFAEFKRTGS
jgi:thioredoxin-related protein